MTRSRDLILGLLLVLGIATPLRAGTAYRFHETSEDLVSTSRAGLVEMSDTSYRVEFDPDPNDPQAYDLLLSRDGGQNVTAVDRGQKTYFALSEMPSLAGGRKNEQPVAAGKAAPRDLSVALAPPSAGPTVFGHATSLSVVRGGYSIDSRFGNEKVRQFVDVEVRLWIAADLPRRSLPVDPAKVETGSAALDSEIEKALAPLVGQALRQELKVTRHFEGSQPFARLVTIAIESWDEASPAAERFELPAGLRHQVPVVSTPAKIR